MTEGRRDATVYNSPKMLWFQVKIHGGTAPYDLCACCSMCIDDFANVGIIASCAP